jgi:TolA-binding protein
MRKSVAVWTTIGFVAITAVAVRADILVTPTIVYTGEVIRADNDGVTVKSGENELTVRRADIQQALIAKPALYDKSLALVHAGKSQEAKSGFEQIVKQYAGVPLPWVEDSLCQYGEILVDAKDFKGAKDIFDRFKRFYPKSERVQVLDAKYARILFEQKEPEKAMTMIKGVIDPLLKREYLSEEQEVGVAEGLVLLGDCEASLGKRDNALDDYLRVIALFDVDPERTAEAKFKSAKLLEQLKNWHHAKQNYEDVVKEAPDSSFAADAKTQLAELTRAHPE